MGFYRFVRTAMARLAEVFLKVLSIKSPKRGYPPTLFWGTWGEGRVVGLAFCTLKSGV